MTHRFQNGNISVLTQKTKPIYYIICVIDGTLSNFESVPSGVELILGGMHTSAGKTILLSQDGTRVLPDLDCSTHEEADTRMFAHITHSATNRDQPVHIIVKATDTDVVLLSIYYSSRIEAIAEIWIQKNDVFIPCHKISQELATVCKAEEGIVTGWLLNTYILTGCDTVSFPFKKGKRCVANLALKTVNEYLHLTKFENGELSETEMESVLDDAKRFFIRLYGRDNFEHLDKLRAHLFGNLSDKADLRSLPPTDNAFKYHALRALHQIHVSRNAHKTSLPLLSLGERLLMGSCYQFQ